MKFISPSSACSTLIVLAAICAALTLATPPLQAQEANVLGLPAVPQPKPGSALPAGSGAGSGATAGAAQTRSPSGNSNRDAIAGELGLQHSSREGVGRLIVTTRTVFATAGTRGAALDTGKLVQKELAMSCGRQCQPIKMALPKILTSGQLEFELAFAPLHQNLNQAQFLAVLQGKPLNLLPAQLQAPPSAATAPPQVPAVPAAAPAVAPAISVQVVTATAAQSLPAPTTPSK